MIDYISGLTDPLSNPVIKTYYQNNLLLARSIAFKSSRSAEILNTTLIDQYGTAIVNENDPTTWKYYLNLSGEYHPTDTVMTIMSLDTLTPITFSKQNLAANPNTKAEYQFGSHFYQTLVNQYPQQEDLIMGIIMPCDINTAIAANDFDILRWDTNQVESNEYSLIKLIETEIKNHAVRYYVDAYSQTDSYYLMFYYSLLSQFIFMKLLNIRDSMRNTYEVNSFHVKMALAGYMGLDHQYEYLTQKQALYLYRNLPRLVKSIGFDTQFDELVQNLLTERDIILYGYTIRQKGILDTNYSPVTVVISQPLNSISPTTYQQELTLQQVFTNEESVLYGTKDYYDDVSTEIIFDCQTQNQSQVMTKDLFVETDDNVPIFSLTMEDFVLRHWIYMSSNGLYTALLNFTNPITSITQTLSAKDAFVYMYYLTLSYAYQALPTDTFINSVNTPFNNILNFTPDNGVTYPNRLSSVVKQVPDVLVQMHVNQTPPTFHDLISLVDRDNQTALENYADWISSNFVPMPTVTDTSSFYTFCVKAYNNYIKQYSLVTSIQNSVYRGEVKNMLFRSYSNTLVHLYSDFNNPSNPLSINDFLIVNNLDSYETIAAKGTQYVAQLIANLLESGISSSPGSSADPKYVTKAMVAILKSLTSYNVQYINIFQNNDPILIRMEPAVINGSIAGVPGGGNGYLQQNFNILLNVYVQDTTVEQITP